MPAWMGVKARKPCLSIRAPRATCRRINWGWARRAAFQRADRTSRQGREGAETLRIGTWFPTPTQITFHLTPRQESPPRGLQGPWQSPAGPGNTALHTCAGTKNSVVPGLVQTLSDYVRSMTVRRDSAPGGLWRNTGRKRLSEGGPPAQARNSGWRWPRPLASALQ